MNTVIVNNKPRPVVPSPLVVGRNQSVFNVFGYSLWNNDVLDKEIAQAQERHAKEIERYEEKAKVWERLVSIPKVIFVDTNITLNEGFGDRVKLFKSWGFEFHVTRVVIGEIKNLAKCDRLKASASEALDLIKREEIITSEFTGELCTAVKKKVDELFTDSETNQPVHTKGKDGFINDRKIESAVLAHLLRKGDLIFVSDDKDMTAHIFNAAEKKSRQSGFTKLTNIGLDNLATEIKFLKETFNF